MKLWFDEDLSPTLVQVAQESGFEATCNRDRGVLGISDPQLRAIVQGDQYVFVTNNGSDFRPMYSRDAIHPGIVVMPAAFGRETQQTFARMVIGWIVGAAEDAGEIPADYMVNRLVEINEEGECRTLPLP